MVVPGPCFPCGQDSAASMFQTIMTSYPRRMRYLKMLHTFQQPGFRTMRRMPKPMSSKLSPDTSARTAFDTYQGDE